MKHIIEQQYKTDNELLFLMPLVQTAWAHGAIATREKYLIFEAAREDGVDERSSLNDRLDNYLVNQPGQRFFAECLDEIGSILQAMTVNERESLKAKIVKRCQNVAASAGGNSAMDVSAFISAEERKTLEEIGEKLNIASTNKERFDNGGNQPPVYA